MIVLDTQIWIWWVNNSDRLTEQHRSCIQQYQSQGLGVSVISCWEVAKLVENNRLQLSTDVEQWLNSAIAYPSIRQLDLSIPIIVESTQLQGFHRDPADQLIVATARIYQCPLLTADRQILAYSGVQTL